MAGIRILILDDRPEDIELLSYELKKASFDYEIRDCHDRDSYLEELQSFEPNIILSDYNLGSFSGLEALEIAREFSPEIPFIIVSGFIGEQEAVNLIVDHGVNDYIIKDNLKKLNTSVSREIERYRLQSELKEKSAELRKLSMVASHTHNGVMIIKEDRKLEWVNKAYLSLTGFKSTECIGYHLNDILRESGTSNSLIKEIDQLLDSENPFSREIQNKNKKGENYWVKLTITPIIDKTESQLKFVCILEEITARKKAEFTLQENLERLKDSQRMGKLGHWEYDLKNKKLSYSDSLIKVYNIEKDQELTDLSDLWNLYAPESREKLRNNILNAINNRESFEIDLQLLDNGSSQKYVRALGIPVTDHNGDLIALKGITQDITDRVMNEYQIQESRELLKNITDNVTGAVTRYIFRSEGQDEIVFANKGVKDIYAVSPEDVIQNPDLIWSQIHPEDAERVANASLYSRKNRVEFSEVFRVINPDGTVKWIRVVSRPVESTESEAWDTLAFDISELKEMESKLKRTNVKLSQSQKIAKLGYYEYYPELDKMIWSEELRNIFNVGPDEEVPSPSEQSKFFSEEELEIHEELMKQCLSEKRSHEHISTLHFEDGTRKYIKIFNRYIENEDGVPGMAGSVMDITNDRIKEKLLIESEQRLDAAINGADLGIWDLNLKTGENFTNSNWWKMLGYDSDEIEFNYEFFQSILHPDDKELPEKEIKRIENGGENRIDIVIRLKDKTGKWKRILDRGKVVEFDSEGNVVRLIGTHMDITERFILEEELSKTKTLYELAVDGSEIGIWEMDIETGSTFFNEKWYSMLGYTKSEIEFSLDYFYTILHPDDHDRVAGEYRKIKEQKQQSFELIIRLRHKNGDYVWILDRAIVVDSNNDGTPKTLAGSHLDITERIKAERSYMESNIKLRALINSSQVGIYLIDAKGKIIDFWNPAAEQIFGYTSEEVMGKFLPFVGDHQEDEFRDIINRIKNGDTISNMRLKRFHKNGNEKIVEINTGPIFNENNEIDSILVIVNDITELVEKENRIQESLKEKETLLGEIHHRVKNNLAIVSGILEIQQFTSEESATLVDAVNRIRSIAMVHEQLYNSDNFNRIDINEYYQNLVNSVLKSSGISKESVETIIDISAKYISINQAVPLGLIINELLTNSIKHAFSDSNNIIELKLIPNERGYEFVYSDNGPGFDMEEVKSLGSMGWELLLSLLDQIHADYELDTEGRFLLNFTFRESERGSHSNLSDSKY
ncbi:PAS domain S-box protein [Balneola sp. MJW-20]|uniref:PAS domain S-box protein n=1 Tax=Gracilimonas aurantiaca TaxID=3234185 RepID=UPI003467623D